MSLLKRNGKSLLLRERWLPTLELGSSMAGSVLATAAVDEVDRFTVDPGIEMVVSIIGALELELSLGGSGFDIVSTMNSLGL